MYNHINKFIQIKYLCKLPLCATVVTFFEVYPFTFSKESLLSTYKNIYNIHVYDKLNNQIK